MAKREKKLEGNRTKVDSDEKIESLYQSNTATLSEKKDHETPLVNDQNVKSAKHFVDENEK